MQSNGMLLLQREGFQVGHRELKRGLKEARQPDATLRSSQPRLHRRAEETETR